MLILGAGTMGAQNPCDDALAGHDVTVFSRNADAARQRTEETFGSAEELGLFRGDSSEEARTRVRTSVAFSEADSAHELTIESQPEDLPQKVKTFARQRNSTRRRFSRQTHRSLSVTAIGQSGGAPERMLGSTTGTRRFCRWLRWSLGRKPMKRPCRLLNPYSGSWANARSLRRCVRLGLEQTSDGCFARGAAARRIWLRASERNRRNSSPTASQDAGGTWACFDAICLGGAETWERAAENLLPELSTADAISDLRAWLDTDKTSRAMAEARRDRGLARVALNPSGLEQPRRTEA